MESCLPFRFYVYFLFTIKQFIYTVIAIKMLQINKTICLTVMNNFNSFVRIYVHYQMKVATMGEINVSNTAKIKADV